MGRMSGQSVFDTKLEIFSHSYKKQRRVPIHKFALKRAALSKMNTQLVVSQLRLQKEVQSTFKLAGQRFAPMHGCMRDDVHFSSEACACAHLSTYSLIG